MKCLLPTFKLVKTVAHRDRCIKGYHAGSGILWNQLTKNILTTGGAYLSKFMSLYRIVLPKPLGHVPHK